MNNRGIGGSGNMFNNKQDEPGYHRNQVVNKPEPNNNLEYNNGGTNYTVFNTNKDNRYLEEVVNSLNNNIDDVYRMETIVNSLLNYLNGEDDFIIDPDYKKVEFNSIKDSINSRLYLLANKNRELYDKLLKLEEAL